VLVTGQPFPRNLSQFQAAFPDDAACRAWLASIRWAAGFACPGCGGRDGWVTARRGQMMCRACGRQVSVTSGTRLEHLRLPLTTLFWAAYLAVTLPGLNSVTLGRQFGLTSRQTAHRLLTTLRDAMATLPLSPLGGVIEADEMVVGGVTPGVRGWKVAGTAKRLVLVAAEQGTTRTRMVVIADRRGATLVPLLAQLVAPGSTVVTDGHSGYAGLPAAGFLWRRVPHPAGGLKRGGAGRATPAVDGAISRYKRWLLGTYNKPPADYAPYLGEFAFRSEFRRQPTTAFEALLGQLVG